MLEDWQVSLVLVLLVTCILIATTLSVFYITVATLARDVDRTYKQINNLFHKLRVTAEENKENDQDAETLAKSIDGEGVSLFPSQHFAITFEFNVFLCFQHWK
jgi:hypothetical protein